MSIGRIAHFSCRLCNPIPFEGMSAICGHILEGTEVTPDAPMCASCEQEWHRHLLNHQLNRHH